jgi:HEAT repeat protein
MDQPERQELLALIGSFIEMGHVENIAAMFRQDRRLYSLTGDLLRDERFIVRVGMAVLFEELAATRPAETQLALPFLLPLLQEDAAHLRGDAATLLGIIASAEALAAIVPLQNDRDPQVAEIAVDILTEQGRWD